MENALPGPARPSPGEGFGPDCPGRAAGRPDVGMTRCSQNYCRPFRGISPSIQRPGVRWYAFLLHCPFLCLPLRPSSPRQSVHSLLLPPSPHPASRKRLDGTHAPPSSATRRFSRFLLLPGDVVQAANPSCLVSNSSLGGCVAMEGRAHAGGQTTVQDSHHLSPGSSFLPDDTTTGPKRRRKKGPRRRDHRSCMHACCFRRASVRAAAHSTCTWCMPDELSSQPGQGASSSRPHHVRSCGCCAGQISVSGAATYIRYVDSARS